MKLFKAVTGVALSSVMLLSFASGAFAQPLSQVSTGTQGASVTLNGQTTYFSGSQIERLAQVNNVDPNSLREAIEAGPDADGKFSPFSKLPRLDNGISEAQLFENSKQKLSSTGESLIQPAETSTASSPFASTTISALAATTTTKSNQDSTAYNATGNNTANGNLPRLGIVAVHRVKDITSGSTSNSPVIPFGTSINVTNVDIYLPNSGYRDIFTVDDTGLGPNRTDYWIDVYFGTDTTSAINYGVTKVSYTY
ncbi:hypothetical protein PCCS19_39360 [Paenibacillus sp. CCS19]|uniref:hypothetical protein n=1 Tax=Paenibacillus sp. CCS19 TaxID=3158387 RepID=UPI00255E2BB5|nr:hypothetical protein [Paenibacillus cellulosilyticus]GMK40880.1 hypothetical protein PCCS19_39360 [Paenibacillus cellulosilyticus]